MNFFQAREQAQRLSIRLVFLFLFSIAFISLLTTLTLIAVVPYLELPVKLPSLSELFFHPYPESIHIPGLIFFSILLAIATVSAIKYWALRVHGAKGIASMMGGRLISAEANLTRAEKTLRNIVEEMSISATIPIPQLYVLDQEPGINAAAIGLSHHDAAIVVTRGFLKYYSRDEAEAVIAHEIAHIFNGDMRLNLNIVALLHGLLFFSHLGKKMFLTQKTRSQNRKREIFFPPGFILLGIIFTFFGGIGYLLGSIIKASLSRQREFLADATAVQFTRNPLALTTALTKLLTCSATKIHDPATVDFSHAFFSSTGLHKPHTLLNTHPPLRERIDRIYPNWLKRHFPPKVLKNIGMESLPSMFILWGQDERLAFLTSTLEKESNSSEGDCSSIKSLSHIAPEETHYNNPTPRTSNDAGKRTRIEILLDKTLSRAQSFSASLTETMRQGLNDPDYSEQFILGFITSIYPGLSKNVNEVIINSGIFEKKEEFFSLRQNFAALDIPALTFVLDQAIVSYSRQDKGRKYKFIRLLYQIFTADQQLELFEWTSYIFLRKRLGFSLTLDYESPPPLQLRGKQQKIAGSLYLVALLLALISSFPSQELPKILGIDPPFDISRGISYLRMEELTYATIQIAKLPQKNIQKYFRNFMLITSYDENVSDNEYDILNALSCAWDLNLRHLASLQR